MPSYRRDLAARRRHIIYDPLTSAVLRRILSGRIVCRTSDQPEDTTDHMSPNPIKLASSSKAGHLTKQQFVYTTLRESIIRSELPPGTRLVIDDLARQFKVSIIPVREALRLLQS